MKLMQFLIIYLIKFNKKYLRYIEDMIEKNKFFNHVMALNKFNLKLI